MESGKTSVFDIQRLAEQTRDANELCKLLLLVPESEGSEDQKQILVVFINGGINNPSRQILTAQGGGRIS